jgi:hypothetical protein
VYSAIVNNAATFKKPISRPAKLVRLRRRLFTSGYIRVKMAMITGVVGQNITPKLEVSSGSGLKFGFHQGSWGTRKPEWRRVSPSISTMEACGKHTCFEACKSPKPRANPPAT